MCGYNKNKEIETASRKGYIKDFYGNPKSLHRLEVHQNNEEIKDFCKNNGISQDISLIFNQNFLDAMYDAHLSSLLRFTKGRTKLEWRKILQWQGMITTLPTIALLQAKKQGKAKSNSA